MPEFDEMRKEFDGIYNQFQQWIEKHANKYPDFAFYEFVEEAEEALGDLSDELDQIGAAS